MPQISSSPSVTSRVDGDEIGFSKSIVDPSLLLNVLEHQNTDFNGAHIREHAYAGRNQLFDIEDRTGKRWVAKQNLWFGSTERWFYENCAPTYSAAPACLFSDETWDLVVVEHIADAVSLSKLFVDNLEALLPILDEVGANLARLHNIDATQIPRASIPFPSLDPVDVKAWEHGSPASRAVIRELQRQPLLSSVYHDSLGHPGRRSLIHGDLRGPNILCSINGQYLIDWECCGLGSPGWDLGAILGDLLMAASSPWTHVLRIDQLGHPLPPSLPIADLQLASRRFLSSYRTNVKHGDADAAYAARYTAASIIGRTYARAMQSYQVPNDMWLRMLIAETVLSSPAELFGSDTW